MATLDPYEILGLWPGASEEQIHRAYRRAAKRYHPDINKSAYATEEFLKVQMAYSLLIRGSGGKSAEEVIRGDGWSASRSSTWADFAERAESPRKVRVARNTTSVSSPFYRKTESPISYDVGKGAARKRLQRTVWWIYLTVMAALTVGFLGMGFVAIGTGSYVQGAVSASFGLALVLVLMFVIRLGERAGFTSK